MEAPAVEPTVAPETPAQAALHEPDMLEDEATAALYNQLMARLDGNLADFVNTFRGKDAREIAGMSTEIGAAMYAHYYLSETHNFHASELAYLLRFKDPLSVVADEFAWAIMINEERSDVMRRIFDHQGALQEGYELMPDKPAPSPEERVQQLRDRLSENYEAFKREMMACGVENMFFEAPMISAALSAYSYFYDEYHFAESEVNFLLKFQNPLELIIDKWSDGMGIAETVNALFKDQERTLRRGGYGLVAEESTPVRTAEEKTSVLAWLREARDAPKEPRGEKHPRGRGGPEL